MDGVLMLHFILWLAMLVRSISPQADLVASANAQRADYGVAPYTETAQLDSIAQARADDMTARGYFAHTYGGVMQYTTLLANAGVSYAWAGEDLASGYTTPQAAVTAWMNSPTHRANILSGDFDSVGAGISGTVWVLIFLGGGSP